MKHKITAVLCSVIILVFIGLSSCKKEPPTKAYAGEDQYIYDTNIVLLDGNKPVSGNGEWTILSGSGGVIEEPENPNSVFRGNYNGSYVLKWTIRNSLGFSNDDVTIAFFNAVAFTGNDTIVYDDTTYQLRATEPSEGTGHWEIISGENGNIDDIRNPKATLTGQFGNTYLLRWTVVNPGPNDTAIAYDEMQISFVIDELYPDANILIPDTIVFSSTNINLTAETPNIGNGVWTVINGTGGSFGSSRNPNSSFSGTLDAAYTLKWTVTNRYGVDADTLNVTFSSPVSAQAGQAGQMINSSSDQSDNSTIEKYCYNDDANNCATCGGLYQWDELMQYQTTERVQGICPEGWHVPSDEEWKTLEISLGMSQTDANKGGWRGSPIGTSLKQGGTSGFDALLCGRCSETNTFLLRGLLIIPLHQNFQNFS